MSLGVKTNGRKKKTLHRDQKGREEVLLYGTNPAECQKQPNARGEGSRVRYHSASTTPANAVDSSVARLRPTGGRRPNCAWQDQSRALFIQAQGAQACWGNRNVSMQAPVRVYSRHEGDASG